MSLEAIEKKIREDGKAEAQRIVAEAEAHRKEELEKAKKREQSRLEEEHGRLKKRMEDRRQRMEAHQRRQAEQRLQNHRRSLIDQAIESAVDSLVSQDDERYLELIAGLLRSCSLEGEVEVLVSQGDRKRITADFLKRHSDGDRSFVLSDQTHSGRGGVVLRAGKVSQNATFDMIASLAHDDLVMELAAEIPLESE